MRTFPSLLVAVLAVASGVLVAAPSMPLVDGLEKVDAKRVDEAWIDADADFSSYGRVIIDPAEVSFRKNWMRDVNRMQGASRIRQQDAEEIAAAAREGFDDIFANAFRKAGFEVVTEPGVDVLRLTPAIKELYIDSPGKLSELGNRNYSVEAGEAVLVLVASDSHTGAVLGVALDRRKAGDRGGSGLTRFDWRTSASNRADFERLFRSWADDCVDGLADLKAQAR